jgi:hypothetical protein
MRELPVLTFMTLDGVMQAPKMPEEDRSGGFDGGGWADPYWDEVMTLIGKEAMVEPYDVLFGGNTYDVFAAHATDNHPMHKFHQNRRHVETGDTELAQFHGHHWRHCSLSSTPQGTG